MGLHSDPGASGRRVSYPDQASRMILQPEAAQALEVASARRLAYCRSLTWPLPAQATSTIGGAPAPVGYAAQPRPMSGRVES